MVAAALDVEVVIVGPFVHHVYVDAEFAPVFLYCCPLLLLLLLLLLPLLILVLARSIALLSVICFKIN